MERFSTLETNRKNKSTLKWRYGSVFRMKRKGTRLSLRELINDTKPQSDILEGTTIKGKIKILVRTKQLNPHSFTLCLPTLPSKIFEKTQTFSTLLAFHTQNFWKVRSCNLGFVNGVTLNWKSMRNGDETEVTRLHSTLWQDTMT